MLGPNLGDDAIEDERSALVVHHHEGHHEKTKYGLPKVPTKDSPITYIVHVGLIVFHLLVVVAALVISCWTVALALNQYCNEGQCKDSVYITKTFYSTNDIGSLAGWAVATERPQLGELIQYPTDTDSFAFSHYFECMHTAKMANAKCSSDKPVADYVFCLKNDTSTKAALDACDTLSVSHSKPWPTAEDYLNCLYSYPVMGNSVSYRASQNVFRSCVAQSLWPFFEAQQGLDSPLFLGSYNWLILLVVGLICMTSFGVYTASPWEHGVVKHGEADWHMRLGALWIFVSFAWNLAFFIVFFVVAMRAGTDVEGDDSVPTTSSTTNLTLFFLGAHVLYFLCDLADSMNTSSAFVVHVFKHATRTQHYKEHQQTEEVRDHGRVVFRRGEAHEKTDSHMGLGSNMPTAHLKEYTISEHEVAKYYTPPLLQAWADGYLADCLILLGMMGATGHVTTRQAWNGFALVLVSRLLNSQIARYMYQCFMNNLAFSDESKFKGDMAINKMYHDIQTYPGQMISQPGHALSHFGKYHQLAQDGTDTTKNTQEAHLNIQVMALSTQISNIFLFSGLIFLTFDGDTPLKSVDTFMFYMIFAHLIPESLRIIVHLLCQFVSPSPNGVPWTLLNVFMFLWTWDLAVRVCFVAYVVLSLSPAEGTRRFLFEQSYQLLDVYLPTFTTLIY
jgi:hypothetical protein